MDDATLRDAASASSDGAAADTGVDQSRLTNLVGYASTRASIVMKKIAMRHLGPLDLKVVDYSILVLVASNPQINPKRLGQPLDISAPNLAVTLDRLVERGWVQRVRSTEDRRAMHIHLTAAGRELVQRAEKITATMENAQLRMLSPAERALLIELLMKVVSGGKPPKRG